MDKQKAERMREDINQALQEVGARHGCYLEMGNIRYDDDGFKGKLKAVETGGPEGDKRTADKIEFEKHAEGFGIDLNTFGKTFVRGCDVFEIDGISPRARKYPVLATKQKNGKRYKFPPEVTEKVS